MALAAEDCTVTRFGWVMVTYFSTLAIGISGLYHPAPRLVWNASASVPIGLYGVQPASRLHVNDMVVVAPPEPLARFLAERGYLPKRVPLMKRILALPGQIVCRTDLTIRVDGVVVGAARKRDRRDRDLPTWRGCHVITEGEVFLMNRQPEDSLDGRYFGPLPATSIVGRAVPLWTLKEE
jgi:conjugative transfer signal peptidase TraF